MWIIHPCHLSLTDCTEDMRGWVNFPQIPYITFSNSSCIRTDKPAAGTVEHSISVKSVHMPSLSRKTFHCMCHRHSRSDRLLEPDRRVIYRFSLSWFCLFMALFAHSTSEHQAKCENGILSLEFLIPQSITPSLNQKSNLCLSCLKLKLTYWLINNYKPTHILYIHIGTHMGLFGSFGPMGQWAEGLFHTYAYE